MKTISVREVAEALNISPRGVLYRREKGHLKGILVKNERGVDEYRIYPTKEIIEGLRRINSPLVASGEAIEGFEIVDAQTVPEEDKILDSTYGESDVVSETGPSSNVGWTESARVTANRAAEQLWDGVISRFMEKIEAKDQLIGELRTELADKDRQLKLLPDLQKKAMEAELESKRAEDVGRQAEEDRKNAEIKALEVEALKRQIAAIQEQNLPTAGQLEQIEAERLANKSEVKLLREQLDSERTTKEEEAKALIEYKRVAEEAQRKLEEMQRVIDEGRQQIESAKSAETAAIREQLAELSQKLEKTQVPWWKKMFMVREV